MRITDNEKLEYLHDAVVSEISLVNANGYKRMRITATCDEECGYDDWSGKVVTVTFSDVIRASGVLFGHVAGEDIVNSFSKGVSVGMDRSIQELRSVGIAVPEVVLTLTLHSGSEIEVACGEIDVTVIDQVYGSTEEHLNL